MHDVLKQLQQKKVISGDGSIPLRVVARLNNLERQIRAGEYSFPKAISLSEFLRLIARGESQVGVKVTIIEGWTFRQMREQLRNAPKLKQASTDMTDRQIMTYLGYPGLFAEGRFFPDTYSYTSQHTDLSIYRQAFQLMKEKLDFAWKHRDTNLPIKTKDEMLTMASIIEKESQVLEEQPWIASVFYNRLRKGMRLQADPTVIYGMGDLYKDSTTRIDLQTDSPYNTYRRSGLTPTPISLPGASAINAAAHPAKTDDYYFVATGDGRHDFSETLEEHNKAVQKYRRTQKN